IVNNATFARDRANPSGNISMSFPGSAHLSIEPQHPTDPPSDPALMHEITMVLQSVKDGDSRASEALLQLVYDQLRALARSRLKKEPGGGAGMTLDAKIGRAHV